MKTGSSDCGNSASLPLYPQLQRSNVSGALYGFL
jgi:hypothetical protein